MVTVPTDTRAYLQARSEEVEGGLAALALPDAPAALYAPVRYVLEGGGKRVRPVLVLLAAEAFGGEEARRRALPAALAVEVFHNFTLVHDDIMDGAQARRGRPTVHVRWDAATAILAGDLLMGLSYDLLAKVEGADAAALVRRFHTMMLRLCEGQALDAAFERRDSVAVPEYLDMIERKTGALLEAALDLGGMVGGAGAEGAAALQRFGRELGRAFQIQDDLLDLTAESDGWGKAVGGDLVAGKRTFLLLRTLERASGTERAWFTRALNGGLSEAEVPEARARMDRLGVLDEARAAVRRHSDAGLQALGALPPGPAADALRVLAERLVGRGH